MIKNTLIFGVGFLLPFVAGEAVLRVLDPYHFEEKEDWTQYGIKIMKRSANRLNEGAVASYLGKKTVISRQGWRSPEFEVPKPDGVYRIVVLGGSVPFGWGVEQGDEFPRVLAGFLNEARLAGDKRIEVINTGVPGWRIEHAGRFLAPEGLGWKPDMVLLTLVATDVPTKRNVQVRGEIFNNDIRQLRLARVLENRLMFNTPGSQGKAHDAYQHIDEAGLRPVNAALANFQHVCREAGARFVVFDTLGRDAVKARCAELGIHRIDGFTSWSQRRSWEIAVTDAHPNAEGHRYLARTVFDGLLLKSLWETK